MGVKHWVRAMLVLAALPATAAALGLGEIRLNSPLNAPLDAEIELVNATAEELAGLRAQLASRETFARYGLEWPAFLGSITLSRAKSANGKDVLRVRSSEAITEPFVTLLVDANWGRGRLVREYTLLLDPPTFSPAQAAVAPVQAAVTPAAKPAAVERPASSPVALEPAEARAPSAEVESITDGLTVRRGDTLSGIAARAVVQPEVSLEQAMVGLYRANPRAFDGTMNDLRAGSVLRLPESADMTSISREAAVAEVRRQGVEWRNRGAETSATGDGAGRLRLVPPTETPSGTAAASGAGTGDPAELKALRDRLGSLERELTESRRQLELRSAEIAALQARLAGTGTAAVAAAPPAAAGAPPAPTATPVAEPGVASTAPVPAPAPAPEVAAPAVEAPVAATPPPARPRPATPAVEEPEPVSMLDSVIGLLTRFWWAAAGLLVLLAGLFGFRRWQQRREVEPELSDIILPTPPDLTPLPAATAEAAVPATSETSRLRRPNIAAPEETAGFVVEESGEYERPVAQPEPAAPMVSLEEETLSGDTNLNLDQGDPLAEADFHMAYGLYDQAADLVKLAMGREPKRRDLRLKLAEVYFVWGNRDEFLDAARQLHETRAAGMPGEWDKVVIMGRQIAPDDPLFAGVAVSGTGTGSGADSALDLPLGEGEQPLDFDLMSDGGAATQLLDTAEVSEDLANPESDSPTEIFDLGPDDGEGGVSLRFTDSPTMESSRLDLDLGDELSEAPTVEQPGLSAAGGFALRQKLDAALREGDASVEQTAELAIDDLGLDLGDLDKLDGDDEGADVIDLSERRNERAQQQSAAALARQTEQDASATALIEIPETQRLEPDFDLSAFETSEVLEPAESDADAAATLIQPLQDLGSGLGRDLASDEDFDLDLDLDEVLSPAASTAAESDSDSESLPLSTGSQAEIDVSDMAELEDLTAKFESGAVGGESDFAASAASAAEESADDSSIEPQVVLDQADDELLLNPFEPATISEVGTKLDLARAYIDMGDPDGARSILLEVLQEGSVTQKQEAQRLVEALPG